MCACIYMRARVFVEVGSATLHKHPHTHTNAPAHGVHSCLAVAPVQPEGLGYYPPSPQNTHPPSALARKNGYRLAYNQEIVGLGIANFAGAMFSAYTTTGSFSRSAVNNASGGWKRGYGLVQVLGILVV